MKHTTGNVFRYVLLQWIFLLKGQTFVFQGWNLFHIIHA